MNLLTKKALGKLKRPMTLQSLREEKKRIGKVDSSTWYHTSACLCYNCTHLVSFISHSDLRSFCLNVSFYVQFIFHKKGSGSCAWESCGPLEEFLPKINQTRKYQKKKSTHQFDVTLLSKYEIQQYESKYEDLLFVINVNL